MVGTAIDRGHADATTLAELIRTREVSPVEVMQAHLDRIEAVAAQVTHPPHATKPADVSPRGHVRHP